MISIRRARVDDAQAATAVAFAAKRHWGYAETVLSDWAPALTVTAEQIAGAGTFVAVEGKRIVAVVVASHRPNGATAELDHLWVAPTHMGCGIGRRLLRRLCRWAHEEKVGIVAIESDPHAEGFYLRCGARRVGELAAPLDGDPARVLPLLHIETALASARIDSRSRQRNSRGRR